MMYLSLVFMMIHPLTKSFPSKMICLHCYFLLEYSFSPIILLILFCNVNFLDYCQWANFWAGIKSTALLLVFDKENSIEFLLDLLYYIYNYYCGYVSCLPQSLYPSANFFVICCDCDLWLPCNMTISVTTVTPLWLCDGHVILSHASP